MMYAFADTLRHRNDTEEKESGITMLDIEHIHILHCLIRLVCRCIST